MGFFSTPKQPQDEPVKFKYFKAPTTVKVAKPKAKVAKKVVKKTAKKKK